MDILIWFESNNWTQRFYWILSICYIILILILTFFLDNWQRIFIFYKFIVIIYLIMIIYSSIEQCSTVLLSSVHVTILMFYLFWVIILHVHPTVTILVLLSIIIIFHYYRLCKVMILIYIITMRILVFYRSHTFNITFRPWQSFDSYTADLSLFLFLSCLFKSMFHSFHLLIPISGEIDFLYIFSFVKTTCWREQFICRIIELVWLNCLIQI